MLKFLAQGKEKMNRKNSPRSPEQGEFQVYLRDYSSSSKMKETNRSSVLTRSPGAT